MIVWRLVPNCRASAATLAPASSSRSTSARCWSDRANGRPIALPSALARAMPACVRSISRSRSNSATAFNTCIVIRPAALVRSTPPKARQ
ncbi:hypothetical protein X962_5791 [Burkholderia pseudomallei MSHR7343]|nr:hypothetical protein X962_5791 [Burkholderia pseudomallei MSHR7343]